MRFKVIDLSRMTKEGLLSRRATPAMWPNKVIDVDRESQVTCIASWRWDISDINHYSNRLSECAWDGLNLGFRYMLVDVISLPQDSPQIAQQVEEFSKLYSQLHSVIAYKIDFDVKRPWLRHEAAQVLSSPTRLWYLYHKWTLGIGPVPFPLKFSLVIKQICTSRLGVLDINESELPICDTEFEQNMPISALNLLATSSGHYRYLSVNLDRRNQLYASDTLLVYELSLVTHRQALIEKLRAMRSNSVAVPALLSIWAMVQGLSVSIRGVDWNVRLVDQWVRSALTAVSSNETYKAKLTVEFDDREIKLRGLLEGRMPLEFQDTSDHLPIPGCSENLLIRCRDKATRASSSTLIDKFLGDCVDFFSAKMAGGDISEPDPLTGNEPCYGLELRFDDTPRQ